MHRDIEIFGNHVSGKPDLGRKVLKTRRFQGIQRKGSSQFRISGKGKEQDLGILADFWENPVRW